MGPRTIIADIAGNRAEFEALHQEPNLYGSSSVANIMGLNPYCTPLQEWCYRTGKVKREDISGKLSIKKGIALEPVAAELFKAHHGGDIVAVNKVLQHPTLDWAIASPDYHWIHPGGYSLVECKACSYRQRQYWETGAPDYYVVQLQWQMGIDTDAQDGYFSALVGDDDWYCPRFDRSAEIFQQMIELVEKFRAMVKSDTPPDAQAGDDKLIRSLCKAREEEVELQEEALIADYLAAKEDSEAKKKEAAEVECRLKTLQAQIMLKMNGANRAKCGNYGVKIITTHVIEPKPREYDRVTFKCWEVGNDA